MKISNVIFAAAVFLLIVGDASAQSEEQVVERTIEVERVTEDREVEIAERLREAEERMEMAAREIAEITRERLPQMAQIERRLEYSNKPRMGITIDGDDKKNPVEGVEVGGVTPESAAEDAGLRAGDIIISVNGEPMNAKNSRRANKLLLDFMHGVVEGDVLKVEYLRNGNVDSVELTPRATNLHAFTWVPDAEQLHIPNAPGLAFAPKSIEKFSMQLGFPFAGSAWGSMELVELNEGLGRYFGTDAGLLVVDAPDSEQIDLEDGDVIQSIDGREPKDVRHAMRILGSYQSGETLTLGIMRDKKKRTIEVQVPADRRGSLLAPPAALPAEAPLPPKAPVDTAST